MDEHDVVVIGMGPGGEEVAGRLAEAGLDVLGVEAALVGGECPYWGCIPSKMMVRAAHSLAEARRVDQLAGTVGEITPDWSVVARRIREQATDDWDDTVAVDRFTGKGGTFVRGRARLVAPDVVEVAGTRHRARLGVVVATGSRPAVPPVPGLETVDHWTNHEAVEATSLPRSMIVLGGGAIGCELAQVLARFGVAVTLVEAAGQLLPAEEPEAGAVVTAALGRDGVTVLTSQRAERVARAPGPEGSVAVHLVGGREPVLADRLLVATGRTVDLSALGVDAAGLDPDVRHLDVDRRCRAGDRIWGVGDVTGVGAFTHVAMYQAGVVVRDVLGQEGPPADYRAVPRVTFTDPEVGAVGLSEADARRSLSRVAVGTAQVPSTARGWLHGVGNEGVIKLVADASEGVLVGATSVGPAGGEVLGLLSLAVHARVPVATLRTMIYAYPTFHRGIEDALRDLSA